MAVLVRSGTTSIPGLQRALTIAGVPVDVAIDELPLRDHPTIAPFVMLLEYAALPGSLTSERVHELLLSPLVGASASAIRRLGRTLRALERDRGVSDPSHLASWFAPLFSTRNAARVWRSRQRPRSGASVSFWRCSRTGGKRSVGARVSVVGVARFGVVTPIDRRRSGQGPSRCFSGPISRRRRVPVRNGRAQPRPIRASRPPHVSRRAGGTRDPGRNT